MNDERKNDRPRWLNRTVLGIGLASLLSDWSHEIAMMIMPAFLATMGAAAAWLGLIEEARMPVWAIRCGSLSLGR